MTSGERTNNEAKKFPQNKNRLAATIEKIPAKIHPETAMGRKRCNSPAPWAWPIRTVNAMESPSGIMNATPARVMAI